MRASARVIRRTLLVIGSLTAAWLVVVVFAFPALQMVDGSTEAAADPAVTGVIGLAVVLLGALIHRDIVRRERPSPDGA